MVGVLPISNIHIGSTPTILYFDLYLYSANAAQYVYNNQCLTNSD